MLSDLTAVRGLLALWVFAYHANLHLHFAGFGSLVGRGYLGVDGFFILSGLVLAHRHPRPVQTVAAYGRFWWRRVVRLYPTALAMLMLLGAGAVAGAIKRGAAAQCLPCRWPGVHAPTADAQRLGVQPWLDLELSLVVGQYRMGRLPAVSPSRFARLALRRPPRLGGDGFHGHGTSAAVRLLRLWPQPHLSWRLAALLSRIHRRHPAGADAASGAVPAAGPHGRHRQWAAGFSGFGSGRSQRPAMP